MRWPVPAEGLSQLWAVLLEPFTSPLSRTWWVALLVALAIAGVHWMRAPDGAGLKDRIKLVLHHPSTRLDLQLYLSRQLLAAVWGLGGLTLAYTLATHGVRFADRVVGPPEPVTMPLWALSATYSLVLFVCWDLSRFGVHWWMHRSRVLWAFHQVHHSAELLTPLTFHRIHPVESALYQVRGAVVTGAVTGMFYWAFRGQATPIELLGVPAAGLVLNVLFGNLRHSAIWLRFPAPVERWLLSPAQHQLHHSVDPQDHDVNFGTWLAVWDRALGTLRVASTPPPAFGVPAAERNHDDTLLSAWFGPVRDVWGGRRSSTGLGVGGVLVLSLWPNAARADDDKIVKDDIGIEIIVTDELGTPRVAGSAQTVDETVLEQFEYDDVERILNTSVAGVSTRGEDGFGLRPNIGIRGANSDRSAKVTLMEDGVLLAPAPYAAPAAYYFPMSTRLVGLEVFKGPAATRHGPQTVGGAINLLTRSVPTETVARIDVAGGMRGTFKGHGYAGVGNETAGVVVEGVHLRSNGFKELDGGGSTGFGRSEFMLKSGVRLGDQHALQLKLGYARETSNETYLGLSTGDIERTPYRRYAASALGLMDWQRTQAELAWSTRLADGVQMRTVAYHHYFSRQWRKFNHFGSNIDTHALLQDDPSTGQGALYMGILRGEADTTSADQQLWIGVNDRRFNSYGIQSDLRWTHREGKLESVFETGIRLHGDDVYRLHTEDAFDMTGGSLAQDRTVDTVTTTDSDAEARALAVHAHEDLGIGRVHILPGGRVEVVHTDRKDVGEAGVPPATRTTVLPGIGTLVELTRWLDGFVGTYRGFSPVSPGAAEDVQPELSWNSEAGLRAAGAAGRIELVGFYNQYRNIVGACTFSGGCDGSSIDGQFNGGAARIVGLEAVGAVTILLPGAFSMPVSATWTATQAQFLSTFESDFPQFGEVLRGDFLPYLPRQQGNAQVVLAHPRFDLGMSVSARGGMLDQAGLFPASSTDIPALVMLDASARVRATDWLLLYTTATNLTSETTLTSWRPVGARPVAPFQLMVGVKIGNDIPSNEGR